MVAGLQRHLLALAGDKKGRGHTKRDVGRSSSADCERRARKVLPELQPVQHTKWRRISRALRWVPSDLAEDV